MSCYSVRFTCEAEEDLLELYDFPLVRNPQTAERALTAIRQAIDLLRFSPFSCRKTAGGHALVRELVIRFGRSGYVALFEIESDQQVNILAVRHQREEDFF